MTAPQPTKRVGAGGCLVSIGVFVLSIVAFVGLLVWAGFSVVNDLQASPGVPLGSTSQVTISNTGTQFLFLGNFEAGGSIPLSNPTVTITSPSGSNVPVTANSSTSGSSGANEFRSVGEFNATATGTYTVEVSSPTISSPSTAGAKVYVTNINVGSLGAKVVLATGVGGLLFILSIVLAIVWLVRRSKASKGTPPPYAGGGPGVPPPGTYPPGAAPPGSYPPGTPPGSPPPAAGPPGWSPGPPHTP